VSCAIEALGSRPVPSARESFASLLVPGGELVLADPETGRTSESSVYAGGDIVRGPALVIHAIRDGKAAARAILQQLDGASAQGGTL
jgi:NADPH-dependent glutamate synthase beta subunit-like oxidoreductase